MLAILNQLISFVPKQLLFYITCILLMYSVFAMYRMDNLEQQIVQKEVAYKYLVSQYEREEQAYLAKLNDYKSNLKSVQLENEKKITRWKDKYNDSLAKLKENKDAQTALSTYIHPAVRDFLCRTFNKDSDSCATESK